jgi:glycosyltransferase 2 family protein
MTDAVQIGAGRGRPWRVLRLVLPVAILALLWHLADGSAVLARLAQSDWRWLLAALVATNLQTLLSALRWRLTAAPLGQPLTVGHALGEYYLSQLVNQTLPGGVLGDAARAVRARQSSLATSAQAVVIERLVGQAALLAVMATGFATALILPGGLDWPPELGEATGIVVGTVALVGALAAGLGGRVWPRLGQAFWQSVRVSVLSRRAWPRHVVLGLAIVGCNLLTFAFCARATGTVLSPEVVVTLVPLILTAMLVPLSVAGWGLREGAAVALLPLAGVSPEAALAASLAFGAVILLGSLPGAAVLLRRD